MKKTILKILLLSIFFSSNGQQNLIIDTDGGIDDLRVFNYIYSCKEFNIQCILTNDGALSPIQTANKIKDFVTYHKIYNYKLGIGRQIINTPPPWRTMSTELFWGNNSYFNPKEYGNATDVLVEILDSTKPIIYLAMGPLTNLYDFALLHPDRLNTKYINQIIWYNPGLNYYDGIYYKDDSIAFKYLTDSLNIAIHCIHVSTDKRFYITNEFIQSLPSKNTFAALIIKSHSITSVQEKINTHHFQLWDDLMVVYLINKQCFNEIEHPSLNTIRIIKPIDNLINEKTIFDTLRNLFL